MIHGVSAREAEVEVHTGVLLVAATAVAVGRHHGRHRRHVHRADGGDVDRAFDDHTLTADRSRGSASSGACRACAPSDPTCPSDRERWRRWRPAGWSLRSPRPGWSSSQLHASQPPVCRGVTLVRLPMQRGTWVLPIASILQGVTDLWLAPGPCASRMKPLEKEEAHMAGPLAGVRILDCTTVVLGPWAAQQLGDLGADVVKIEPPEGDTTRQLGPARNPGMAAFYLGCNRSKRSIVLDLKQDAGRNALFKLAETADVLMHNYRPEPAKRLGVEYEAFEKINPRLVYLATYGYRSAGPMGPKAAYDDIIQAGSGLAALQSVVAGQPRFLPTIVADKTSSNGVVSALLAGAVRARAHGQGPVDRSADVRDPGLVRDGRASLRRDLQAGARDGGLQARAQQGAAALSVEGRLLRAAALHRRSLEGVLRPGRPARSRRPMRASPRSPIA